MRCPPSLEHVRGCYYSKGFTDYWTSKSALEQVLSAKDSRLSLKKKITPEVAYFKTIEYLTPLLPTRPLTIECGNKSKKYREEELPFYRVESRRWRDTSIPRDPDPLAILIRKRMIAFSPDPMQYIKAPEKITKPVEEFLPTNTFDDRIKLPMIDEKFARFLIRIGVVHPDAVSFD